MIINHNLSAMNTHRQLTLNNNHTSKSLEKLSSGYRINTAGDDAAGLAISEKMRAQIRGLDMASKNTQDAISLVQTAEGALQETHNILQRMRELAVQAGSDTNEESVDRAALQAEFKQLQSEINDIASKTRFNDQNLIDGTFQKNRMVIVNSGSSGGFIAKLTGINVDRAALLGENTIKITTVAGQDAKLINSGTAAGGTFSGSGIGVLAKALFTWSGAPTADHNGNTYHLEVDGDDVTNMTFYLKDSNNKIVSTIQNVDTTTWYTASGGQASSGKLNFIGVGTMSITLDSGTTGNGGQRIKSGDESALKSLNSVKLTINTNGKDEIITPAVRGSATFTLNGESVTLYKGDTTVNFAQAGISFTFKALSDYDFSGTNLQTTLGMSSDTATIKVGQIQGTALTIQTGANQGDELRLNIDAMNCAMLGISFSRIDSREDASKAITEVNKAINLVSTQRAALGAVSNRLTHKSANLDTSSENLQAAESRIRDVDMAKEMMNFTKQNILTQAATAMLAQANQLPQNVLQLLR